MKPAAGSTPINEVVLAISFDELELPGPRLLAALQKLLTLFPDFDEQLPYEMPEELPTRLQITKPRLPSLQIIGPLGPAKRRYWLTAEDDKSLLVQVQSDYFALNWRVRPDGGPYPGFLALRHQFLEVLDTFRSGLASADLPTLNVQQVELSYINLITPPGEYQDHGFLAEVLDIQAPLFEDVEQLTLSYSRALTSPDGNFFGRSYTDVQTGYRATAGGLKPLERLTLSQDLELRPVVNINTSVRSARHKLLSTEDISNYLEYEHAEATRSFRSITTKAAQTVWGLE